MGSSISSGFGSQGPPGPQGPAGPQGASGNIIQQKNYSTSTSSYHNAIISANDNTKVQNTEGDEWATLAITPTTIGNILHIQVLISGMSDSSFGGPAIALFKDTESDARAVFFASRSWGDSMTTSIKLDYFYTTVSLTEITWKVRVGAKDAGTIGINYLYSGTSPNYNFGNTLWSHIIIDEIAV